MDEKKLQPYLDKMKIVFVELCKKWDMDRYHYGIKIWDEVFNYYGSNKEFTDEDRCKECWRNIVGSFENWYSRMMNRVHGKEVSEEKYNAYVIQEGAKRLDIDLPTTDDIKKNALYALVNDYWTYEDYSMEDFIDEFVYKAKEWIKIYKELEINHSRMMNVFTTDELRLLQELYQDF